MNSSKVENARIKFLPFQIVPEQFPDAGGGNLSSLWLFVNLRTGMGDRNTLHHSKLKNGLRENTQFHLDMVCLQDVKSMMKVLPFRFPYNHTGWSEFIGFSLPFCTCIHFCVQVLFSSFSFTCFYFIFVSCPPQLGK